MPRPETRPSSNKWRHVLLLPAAFLGTIAAGQASDDPFKIAEADTDRWIQIQSRIAKVQSDWKSEKAMLQSTINMLEAEQAILTETLDSNVRASELFLGNRDRLREMVDSNEEGLQSIEQPLSELERSLRLLHAKLPPPLKREVGGHLGRMQDRETGEMATTPTRIQGLVASLTAIDRFSNSLSIARETRPSPSGGEVSVRILYWGLAGAYAIDDANQRAWVIRPRGGTWLWNESDELYPSISEMIASYESDTADPSLVLLPAQIN